MRIGSWCSGVGGLDTAVEELTGGKVVWQSETDPAASKVLAHHWPGVPNHGDLRSFDWFTAEPVDAVCAGFPCQPASSAGKRRGMADERWLWDDIARAVGDLGTRPRWVFLENVPGLLTVDGGQAFARVVHDLAHLGFVGRYRLLPAAAVGAPHRRKRVFLAAAYADGIEPGPDGRGSGTAPPTREVDGEERGGLPRLDIGRDAAAHAESPGRGRCGESRENVVVNGLQPAHMGERVAAYACGEGREVGGGLEGSDRGCGPVQCAADFRQFQPAIDRWADILGRPAPAPFDGRRLSPRFVEWHMGHPDGWVTDHVGRRDALRCLGNSVVTAQAVAAYRSLLD